MSDMKEPATDAASAASPLQSPPQAETNQQSAGDTTLDGDEVPQTGDSKDMLPAEDSGNQYDLEPSDQSAFRMGEEVHVDPAIVHRLSDGFLQHFLPSLEKSKSSITEVLSNQTILIDTVDQENAKFTDCTAHVDLSDMMTKAKLYHNKLLNIKHDMTTLHDKAGKLKRRALRLQQQKQKEELQRAHQQERELEKEQMLTARVASPDT